MRFRIHLGIKGLRLVEPTPGERFEFFSEIGVIGLTKLSELMRNPHDERQASLEKQNDGSHVCEDIRSKDTKDFSFIEYLDSFFNCTVRPL